MSDAFAILYGVLFALAVGLALVLTPLAARVAERLGLVDPPGPRKVHAKPIPYGGGIAVYGTVVGIAVLAYAGVAFLHDRAAADAATLPAFLRPFGPLLGGLMLPRTVGRFGAILVGATAVFAVGLADDRYRLRPASKLTVQTAAALVLVLAGIRVSLFIENAWVGGLLTVVWVVFVTNAFNLLDNMDGLSGGVAFIASALFFIVTLQAGQWLVAALLAVLGGALLGFLWYNFHPARLFLGDAGSLFVGFLLGTLTVAGTYYEGEGHFAAAVMPVLILGVPLFDTASVLWVRWRAGRPLFEGDTNHFSHRLQRLGMSVRQAVLTIYLLGLILGGAATLLGEVDDAGALVILLLGVGVIALIVLLEHAAGRRDEP